MNRVSKALWKRRLTYRQKRVSYWRAKGRIPLVKKWVKLANEAKLKLNPPKPKPQHGIDVSEHNGDVNWTQVKAAGISYCFAKVSEGQDFIDASWSADRVAAMRRAKIKVGVYHYLRPRAGRSGAVEMRWFLQNAYAAGWGKRGDLRPVIDFEESALTPAQTIKYVEQAVAEVKRRTGKAPILYVGAYFWSEHGGGRDSFGCPLWLPAYGVIRPQLPTAWKRYAIWQHTDTGRVAGVSGDVDLNVATDLPSL